MGKYIYRNTTDEVKTIVNVGQVEPGKTIHSDVELNVDGLENVEEPVSGKVNGQEPLEAARPSQRERNSADVVGEEPKNRKGTIK